MTSRLCARTDCEGNGLALWRPVIELRPKGYTGEPVKMFFGLAVCAGCKPVMAKLGPSCLVSDNGWAFVTKAMAANLLAAPDRDSTTLSFARASDANDPGKMDSISGRPGLLGGDK